MRKIASDTGSAGLKEVAEDAEDAEDCGRLRMIEDDCEGYKTVEFSERCGRLQKIKEDAKDTENSGRMRIIAEDCGRLPNIAEHYAE